MREDHVLDDDLPVWCRSRRWPKCRWRWRQPSPRSQLRGFELKRIMRTGTVSTIDNRNWELRDQRGPVKRLSRARAITSTWNRRRSPPMASASRVPYGAAVRIRQAAAWRIEAAGDGDGVYRTQVNQHLQIGIRAVRSLRPCRRKRCIRAARSFFETAAIGHLASPLKRGDDRAAGRSPIP